MVSFEILLVLGAFGFYLYDSGMLLYVNEMVFLRDRRQWNFAYPGNNWLLLGRSPYIPNPLTPDIAIFRVYWSDTDQSSQNSNKSIEQFVTALVPLQYFVGVLLAQFFVVLPFVLFLYGSGPQLLWAFGAIYLNIAVILVVVYRKKDILGVSKRKFLVLSFESLACAPFALNILRKLTLHRSLVGDPIKFAKIMFDQNAYLSLVGVVSKRIDEQLELVDIDTPRYASLQAYKEKIQETNK